MEIYGSRNLGVYTQYNYTTYVSKGLEKTPSIYDIFAITKTTHKLIRDFKAVRNLAESDQVAIEIKLTIQYIKLKHNAVIKGVSDWKIF